jgi:hypothetical protein
VRAVATGRRAAADAEANLGPNHPLTITCQSNLASALYKSGEAAEGIALMRRVVDHREEALGPNHRLTVAARSALQRWTSGTDD